MLNHTTRVINAYNETKNPKNLRFVCVFAMMTLSVTARARFGSSFPELHGGCLSTYTLKSHLDTPTHHGNGRALPSVMCDKKRGRARNPRIQYREYSRKAMCLP